jgi:hypothetical protein
VVFVIMKSFMVVLLTACMAACTAEVLSPQISCPMLAWSSRKGLSGLEDEQHAQSLQVPFQLKPWRCCGVCC